MSMNGDKVFVTKQWVKGAKIVNIEKIFHLQKI